MKLAFILGRKSTLALAELSTVLKFLKVSHEYFAISSGWVILEFPEKAFSYKEIEDLQNRLGGTVKIASVETVFDSLKKLSEFSVVKLQDLLTVGKFVKGKKLPKNSNRIIFSVSKYDTSDKLQKGFIKDFGMTLKRFFEESGQKARFVFNNEDYISAVTFRKKIDKKGVDLCILTDTKGKIYLCKTLTVQDYAAYSKRDYGRPMVSKKSGSLPPKLAQIMVNLATVPEEKYLYDPFCGSGTVLQEAMLQGYNVVGSDISRKAVQQTKQNLGWLKKAFRKTFKLRFQAYVSQISLILKNEEFLSKYVQKDKIGGVATEPFLGPTLREVIKPSKNYDYLRNRVWSVYEELFSAIGEILTKDLRLVLVVPEYKTINGWELLDISKLYEKDFTKVDLLDNLPSDISDLYEKEPVWDRPQSIIRRHIFVLEKKS